MNLCTNCQSTNEDTPGIRNQIEFTQIPWGESCSRCGFMRMTWEEKQKWRIEIKKKLKAAGLWN